MHIFAQQIWLFRIVFQIIYNLLRICIHPALHIGNHILICLIMENTLIVHQTQVIVFLEELLHRSDIILSIGFIAKGPEQD